MKFGSLFSGIEAASVAWLPLGWQCAWVAETDPFARAVLKHRYPAVPNLGDVNEIEGAEPVDLVVFGSPCQSFSVAGKRLGLDDPRGNMALVGLRVVGKLRPRWVVWENVPGVLSSDGGRDFGAFLGLLGELGYGFAYTILDAQHAGVPQRRRRVFVVGCLGDWRGAAAVLFEPESLRGDSPPSREAGERVAPSLTVGAHGSSGHQYRQKGNEDALIAFSAKDYGGDYGDIAPTLRARTHDKSHANAGIMPAIAHSLRADGFDAGEDGTGRGTPTVPFGIRSVRRLTPMECERLMGLADDYTLIPYRGKPASDGPRYRAIGNSFAVTVVRWIGERIQAFDDATAGVANAAD